MISTLTEIEEVIIGKVSDVYIHPHKRTDFKLRKIKVNLVAYLKKERTNSFSLVPTWKNSEKKEAELH